MMTSSFAARAIGTLLALSALPTTACSGAPSDGDDAAPRPDALDPADAPGTPDALPSDSPTTCTAGGVVGECIDVSLCTGDRAPTPGRCPGPRSIQCCTKAPGASLDAGEDSSESPRDADRGETGDWCPTDPTARPNERLREDPGGVGCPAGMVRVRGEAFCVDRYEAALVIVDGAGRETSWSPYYPPPMDKTYRAVSLRGAVPQGYIRGTEAERACAAAKKRLCTNDEWLRACRGSGETTYPYGDVRRDGVCNDARTPHPAVSCFGTTASWIYSELGWPGINQQTRSVERTGARRGCVTEDGVFDMMGNLHEWVDDAVVRFRGGYYADTRINGEGCLYQTTKHSTSHWDYSTGFRCCADAR